MKLSETGHAMESIKNPNHPPRGSAIKVEPIRSKAAIERIKGGLLQRSRYRDYCLFTLGINTAFRANELLSITVDQVLDRTVGDRLELKQSKTKAHRAVTLNAAAIEAIQRYLDNDAHIRAMATHDPTAPLFASRRAEVLTVPAVSRMVKEWCMGAGLPGRHYGSHTMRKTWGYWQYKRNTPLPLLMVAFGHSSQRQTLEYLCIQAQDIDEIYTMEL